MLRSLSISRFQQARKERDRSSTNMSRRHCAKRRALALWLAWGALWLVFTPGGYTQAMESPVPSVDAGLGPCSVDFTINNQNFQPLYDAQIHVHFKYGLWGIRTMDLQVGTDSAGRARVTGLPVKLRRPPLDFVTSYRNASTDWYWPGLECTSRAQVLLNVH